MTQRHDLKLAIGTIKVREPQDYGRFHNFEREPIKRIEHREQYECAAWYENSVANIGQVKPLFIAEPFHKPGVYIRTATHTEFDAVITSNDHTPLFCGNAIGKSENRTGRAKTFGFSVPLITAVKLAMHPVTEKMAAFTNVPYSVQIDADKLETVRDIALQEAWNELEWRKQCLEESYAEEKYGMVEHYAKDIAKLGEEIQWVAYGTTLDFRYKESENYPYKFIRASHEKPLARWFERLTV